MYKEKQKQNVKYIVLICIVWNYHITIDKPLDELLSNNNPLIFVQELC